MRTFNGLQIFTDQLTNSGQLDLRYVRISGNNTPANIYLGNLTQDYSFYSNTNFNITKSFNIYYNNTFQEYTGYMPELIDKKLIAVKNLSITFSLPIKSYSSSQVFDRSDSTFVMPPLTSFEFLGVNQPNYSGWVSIKSTPGIGAIG